MNENKEQIMNGADAPDKGSKPKEKDNVDQFPGQKMKPEHKSEHRLLSFKEFVSDKIQKFNKDTVEKDAMDGPEKGDAAIDTLENEYAQKSKNDKKEIKGMNASQKDKAGVDSLENDKQK